MSNVYAHATWRIRLEDIIVFIVTLMPLVVAIRYKWGENILPLALAPLMMLLFVSPPMRIALRSGFTHLTHGGVGQIGFASLLWMIVSILWAVDPYLAMVGTAKAMGSIGAALAVAAVLTTIDNQRVFPWLIKFTIAAGLVVILTLLSDGRVHSVVKCCEGGMQPHLSGGAVTFALFLWPCVGWLAYKRRSRSCILLVVLAFFVAAFSRSGAAWLAFLAGGLTVGFGMLAPRVMLWMPVTLLSIGFLTAPFLSELTSLLDRSGILGRMSAFHASERAQIWTFYAELFWQRPWTGYGFRAEEIVGRMDRAQEFTTLIPPPYAAFHTHNVSLQVLLQFGIIGAAFGLAIAVAATWRLYIADVRRKFAFAVAPMSAALAAAHVNFSIWEWWWFAAVSLALIFGCRLLRDTAGSNDVEKKALHRVRPLIEVCTLQLQLHLRSGARRSRTH